MMRHRTAAMASAKSSLMFITLFLCLMFESATANCVTDAEELLKEAMTDLSEAEMYLSSLEVTIEDVEVSIDNVIVSIDDFRELLEECDEDLEDLNQERDDIIEDISDADEKLVELEADLEDALLEVEAAMELRLAVTVAGNELSSASDAYWDALYTKYGYASTASSLDYYVSRVRDEWLQEVDLLEWQENSVAEALSVLEEAEEDLYDAQAVHRAAFDKVDELNEAFNDAVDNYDDAVDECPF